jgi:SAM-dependent methyltransferase
LNKPPCLSYPLALQEVSVGTLQPALDALDSAAAQVHAEELPRSVIYTTLLHKLERSKRDCDPAAWERFTTRCKAGHPVLDRLRRSPLTGRAFRKPRGYAGDAETLDYIYGGPYLPAAIPAEVRETYDWEFQTDSCRAVRARREALSEEIDRTASGRDDARVLSVACGHLREAHDSTAVRNRQIGCLTGLDQDPASLKHVARSLQQPEVRPLHGSVRQLLQRKLELEKQDLIYSAGLYDYLEDDAAEQLTVCLFELLAPGGRLVLINFAPSLRDIGYMEAVMDWRLLYRDGPDLERLLLHVPQDAVSEVTSHRLSANNLVQLTVRRS